MRSRRPAWVLLAVVSLSACSRLPAEPPAPPDIQGLIDRLAEVPDQDAGYNTSGGEVVFPPFDTEVPTERVFLDLKPTVPSDAMRQLVKLGTAAVPHLLAHLDDRRPTRVHVEALPGMLSLNGPEDRPPGAGRENSYTVTVGDVCYLAVGLIVNRHYHPVRSYPEAIVIVNSPTRSSALRDALRHKWGSLTEERHRASLVADLLRPGDEGRRIGACKRLAYYYPEALEPLALQLLAQPTYDGFAVETFVQEQLYPEPDPAKAQSLFNAYVARHGEASRDGILLRLFDDLDGLQWDRTLKRYADRPRQLLVQLYGKPEDVKSTDRPRLATLSKVERARVIGKGLIYDHSEKVDRAVREVLVNAGDDDYLASACGKRLVGRGYDADIEAYCRRWLEHRTRDDDPRLVEAMLDKLGWTPLHVAVDRNDPDGLRGLLRGGAKADAPDRSRRTPLQFAAGGGNLEAVRLLVEAGAALDQKDRHGQTPAQDAASSDYRDVAKFLVGRGCSIPDVWVAVIAGRADLVERFLRADPAALSRKTPWFGQTLLHLAARCGDAKVAEVLLAHGASVDAKDEAGQTALHIAAALGSESVARVLLRFRADTEVKSLYGAMTPLPLAAENGHAQVAATLLDAKASPNAKVGGQGERILRPNRAGG